MKLNSIEFSTGETVDYWNGKALFESKIVDIRINPISSIAEYRVRYDISPSSKGTFKTWSTPFNIKQSYHFRKPS